MQALGTDLVVASWPKQRRLTRPLGACSIPPVQSAALSPSRHVGSGRGSGPVSRSLVYSETGSGLSQGSGPPPGSGLRSSFGTMPSMANHGVRNGLSATADFSIGIHKPMLFAALYDQARTIAEPKQLPQTQASRRPNRWSETSLENVDDSYHREFFEDAEAAVNSLNNSSRSDGTSVGVGKYYSWRDAMKCIADAPDHEKIQDRKSVV